MSDSGMLAIAAVNKHASESRTIALAIESLSPWASYRVITVNGETTESYNDIDTEQVTLSRGEWLPVAQGTLEVTLAPHSANVVQLRNNPV